MSELVEGVIPAEWELRTVVTIIKAKTILQKEEILGD